MKKGTHMNAGTNRGQGSKKRAHVRRAHERNLGHRIINISATIVHQEQFDLETMDMKQRVKYCLYFLQPTSALNNVEYANPKPTTPSLRVGTAFSGIGAPEWALKQLGIEYTNEYTNEFMIEIDWLYRRTWTPKSETLGHFGKGYF